MAEMLYRDALLAHQFTACVISEKSASPDAFVTFIETMLASGATPVIPEPLPAAMPVTCVPCPLSSVAVLFSLTFPGQQPPDPRSVTSQKHFCATILPARPGCVALIPESMMQTV